MKNLLPILFGILTALIIALVVHSKFIVSEKTTDTQQPEVAGLKIEYGDENVSKLTKEEFLEEQLKKIVKGKSGRYSLGVSTTNDDFTVVINPDEVFYPASLYKIPLAIGVLSNYEDGLIDLNNTVELKASHISDGSGTLANKEVGNKYAIHELLNLLIKQSDNTAQEMLISKANFNVVYSLMKRDEGIKNKQVIEIFKNLFNEEYLNSQNTSILLDMLTGTSFDDRIHEGLANNIKFAHKIGNWPETGTWHDCGVILSSNESIVVCVLSEGTTFEEFKEVTKNFGVLVTNYFNF